MIALLMHSSDVAKIAGVYYNSFFWHRNITIKNELNGTDCPDAIPFRLWDGLESIGKSQLNPLFSFYH
jgi:hypothetical protein